MLDGLRQRKGPSLRLIFPLNERKASMIRFLSILFALLVGLPVAGQTDDNNVIFNGGFDTDVSGWTPRDADAVTIEWNSRDAEGSPSSGSALVTNISASSSTRAVTGCANLTEAGHEYLFRGSIFIPGGQATGGRGSVRITLHDRPDCHGPAFAGFESPRVDSSTSDEWVESALGIFVPAATQSVVVWIWVHKYDDANSLSINFDNLSLEAVDRRLSFIPAAGLAAGEAGSFWTTDLEVNNPSDGPMTYHLWWLPRGEDNSQPMTSDLFSLATGEGRRHANVLSEVFGLDPDDAPLGALAIAADGEDAFAMARIFNQPDAGGGGTYGQSIPGVSAKGMVFANERRRILFMSENDEFRSNLGCQNGSAASLRINLEIFDISGMLRGMKTMDLPPYSNGQINRILRDWAPIDGYVDVWSTAPEAAFICYGSVLDSVSSDPTTVLPQ